MSTDGQRHASEIAEQMRRLREERDALLHALTAARPFVERFYDYQHPHEDGRTLRIVDEALAKAGQS